MEEKLNLELSKMQEELQLLDTAVKHIDKARTISTTVVSAVQGVPERIDKALQEVVSQYKAYLNASYKKVVAQVEELKTLQQQLTENTQNTLNTSFETTQSKVDEIKNLHSEVSKNAVLLLATYQKFAQDTDDRNKDVIKRATDSYLAFVNKTYADMEKAHQDQLETARKLFDDYKTLAESTEQKSADNFKKALVVHDDYLQKSLLQSEEFMLNLTKMHIDQLEVERRLTDEFLELSAINSKLLEKIDKIDFPQRLNKIDSQQKLQTYTLFGVAAVVVAILVVILMK